MSNKRECQIRQLKALINVMEQILRDDLTPEMRQGVEDQLDQARAQLKTLETEISNERRLV